MSHPAHETPDLPVASDLELGPDVREPGASSAPIWLYDLELGTPEPAPTPAMPRQQVEQLCARSTEDDPFEAFLRVNKVTASEPHPLSEPTVVDANPIGAQERWWIDPPKPSAPRLQRRPTAELPRLTPPQWAAARKTTELRAPRAAHPTPPRPLAPPPLSLRKPVATAFGAVLIGAFVALLFASSTSSATELMVPPPPPAPLVELVAVRVQASAPAPVPVAAPAPAPETPEKKVAKRELAKKKWAAQEWPEFEAPKPAPAPEPVEEPAPAQVDELKRPAF